MPNSKTAKKRVLVNEKKAMRNVAAKSALKTSVKKAKVALANNDADKDVVVKAASISLDKAVTKGLIKKNTANRRKSRLAKALNTANAVAAE